LPDRVNQSSDLEGLRLILGRFLLPHWKQIILLVVASLVAATLTATYPLLLAPAMNIGLLSNAEPAATFSDINLNNLGATLLLWIGIKTGGAAAASNVLLVSVVLFVIAGTLAAVVDFGAHMLSGWISTRAYADLQIEMHRRLLKQEFGFFLHSRTGDLVNRFITDAGETVTSMDFAVRMGLQSALQIVIYGWLLIGTSPSLAVATLLVSLLHLAINRFIGDRLRRSTSEKFQSLGLVSSGLQEDLASIRIIKSFGAEAHRQQRIESIIRFVRQVSMVFTMHKNAETPLRRITDTLTLGLILLLAFRTLQTGEMTFEGFVLFMVVVRLTIAPISLFAQAMTRLQGALGAASQVLEMLKRQPRLLDGPRNDPSFKQQIRLEHVTFGYDADRPVLQDIDLTLNQGELLAVVGPSGSGKSTLVDLVLRLFDPTSGRVTIDGSDVRDFSQSAFRRLFGVVSQESLLFNETIRENVVFGRDTGNPADLSRACDIANATEFIDLLPQKLETEVGDRGVRLSGGQRQRIAIARAIYSQPPILILDEATSALDSESERLVQQAIDRVLTNATAIVIAHRLSTILHADRIVVLTAGRIEAVGRHEELLKSSPTYKRLCEMQYGAAGLLKTP